MKNKIKIKKGRVNKNINENIVLFGLIFLLLTNIAFADLYLNSQTGNILLNTSSTERLRISSSGLVGIGTISPDNLLTIRGSDTDSYLDVPSILHLNVTDSQNTSTTNFITLDHLLNNPLNATNAKGGVSGGIGLGILFRAINNESEIINVSFINVSLVNAANGSEAGALTFYTANRSGLESRLVPRLTLNGSDVFIAPVSGNTYINPNGGRVGIGTTNPTVALEVEGSVNISGGLNVTNGNVLLATSSGNVGIGTASPGARLHVNGGEIYTISTAANTRIVVGEGTGGNQYGMIGWNAAGNYLWVEPNGANNLILQSGIEGTGNVGINTTTPAQTLTIQGTLNITPAGQGSTPAIYVTSGGSVGIGTTTPINVLTVAGDLSTFGSLNATFINATQIFMGGSNLVQTDAPAYKRANYSDEYASTGFKVANVTLYIQDNASLIRISNLTDIFLRNYSDEYARSGFKIANYSDAYASTGFKRGNVTDYIGGDNASLLRTINISKDLARSFSNFNLGNVSNDSLKISGNASIALWNVSGANIFLREITGNVGVGAIRPDNRLTVIGTDVDTFLDVPSILHLNVTDSQNTTVTNIITLDHLLNNPLNATNAKGGVSGGIGLGILFRAINNESEIINVSFINATLVNAANGSEAGALTFYTANRSGASGVESSLVPRLILNGSDVFIAPEGSGDTYINPNGGRVGIGTTSPLATLEVRGGVNISGGLNVTNGNVLLAVTGGSVGIGTILPNTKLEVNGTSTFGGDVNIPGNDLNVGGGYSSGGVTLVGTGTNKGSGQFGSNILLDGDIISVYDVEINQSFIPKLDSFALLGNSTKRFLDAYVLNFKGGNQSITINANTTLIGNLSFVDVETYIYYPAANTLAFGTAGAERVRIDSSGRVGIGDTTPAEALEIVGNLIVSGSINATSINATIINVTDLALGWTNLTTYPSACSAGQFVTQVGDTLTCSTPTPSSGGGWTDDGTIVRLTTGSDLVGIGTTKPENRLTIVGNDTDSYLDVPSILHLNVTDSQNTSVTNIITLDHLLNNPLNATNAKGGVSGGIGLGILFRAINNESEIINVSFINATLVNAANGSEAGALTFYTTAPSGVESRLVPRLILNGSNIFMAPTGSSLNSGMVGIGTTNPKAVLEVKGTSTTKLFKINTTSDNAEISIATGSANRASEVVLYSIDGEVARMRGFGSDVSSVDADLPNMGLVLGAGWGDIRFVAGNGSGEWGSHVTIQNYTGNVGINTTTPAQTLTIQGTLNITPAGQGSTPSIYVTSGGSVGIGTTSPINALTVLGDVSTFGSLNATYINATQIFMGGSNLVQTDAPAYKRANYSDAYASTGFKRGNVTDYIGGDNASLLRTINISKDLARSFSNFNLGNVSNDSLKISGNASIALWNASGANIFLREITGNVGVGAIRPDNRLTVIGTDVDTFLDVPSILHLNVTDSQNTTVTNIITLDHLLNNPLNATNAKGGVSGGIGLGILFRAINNESEIINVSFINVSLVNAANATEAGALTFYTANRSGASGVESRLVPRLILNGTDVFIAPEGSGDTYINPNGGRVGIGTTSPNDVLELIGNVRVSGSLNATNINATKLRINNTLFVNGSQVGIGTDSPSGRLSIFSNITPLDWGDTEGAIARLTYSNNGLPVVAAIGSRNLSLRTNSVDRIYIDQNGNVGIGGTTIPGRTLEVSGSINGTQLNISGTTNLAYASGNVGIGTSTAGSKLTVIGGVNVTGGLNVTTGDVLLGITSGNVGINTTNPASKLEVAGTFNATRGRTSFYVTSDNNVIIHLE